MSRVALVLVGVLLLPQVGFAAPVRSRNLSVTVDRGRARAVKSVVRKLRRARVPGYGVVYKHNRGRWQNATAVATVTPQNAQAWMDQVGKHSIGFMIGSGLNNTHGSGYVRVGTKFYSYNTVRGGGTSATRDMVSYSSGLTMTESTFMATPAEMKGLIAFYQARAANQILKSNGQPLMPSWINPGRSNMRTEGCAGASSSVLNPRWLSAFKRNVPHLKSWGQANGNRYLAGVTAADVRALEGFVARTGARQQTDPKALVRTNFDKAEAVTFFNVGTSSNPLEDLKWNRGEWRGMASLPIIPDLGPGQSSAAFKSERMSLASFASAL